MYGNIDREVPAIQYPAPPPLTHSYSLSLLFSPSFSCAYYAVAAKKEALGRKERRRRRTDRRATSRRLSAPARKRQSRGTRTPCTNPFLSQFRSSLRRHRTPREVMPRERATEVEREERGNERKRKEHLSLLWKSIEESSESASPGQRLCHLIGYVEQFILFFPIPRERGAPGGSKRKNEK